MIMCLDVGNTHIFGGVFKDNDVIVRFRYPSTPSFTSDQLGIFFLTLLKEHQISRQDIQNIAICSVVPALDYTIRSAFIKYFDCDPFILRSGVKTGINIRLIDPKEVGADRIANAIAGHQKYQDNLCIVDFGTATTIDVVTKKGEFIGGVIVPGLKIQMQSLNTSTAKLSAVPIAKTDNTLGKTTLSSIQSGLYHGHCHAIKGLIHSLQAECFNDTAKVIGTGGFASMFEQEGLFDDVQPDLVLHGLKFALEMN